MTDSLKALLFIMRQHAAFPELLKAVEPQATPRYRPSKGKDVPTMGAEMIYASGTLDQHERWIALLTGASQETNS